MARSVLDLIGNTPVVELHHFTTNPGVRILAKLEGTNPGGSIKDRPALQMFREAEERGLLKPESTIVEATSGNTGIALAMVAALHGYRFRAVMAETASVERRKLLRMFGADVVLTDGAGGTNLAIETVRHMLQETPSLVNLNQFENEANPRAHEQTTGPEIVRDVPDVTHVVAGMGTGGTLMGIARFMHRAGASRAQVVGVEPVAGTRIQGLRNMAAYTPGIFAFDRLDETLRMTDDAPAFDLAREVFRAEGISAGISSGAALWGAMELARTLSHGVIVAVFPDRGDRYVSTSLFD
ncbi:MAG TPA: cysteine synthase family protein [Candidatus Cryosericum sp.]|nr:cysteine synthase family protein [Candidatus Cryosericum sp.]HPS69222.1 cysteine synthase family protein [Candidatus Cryosericum sp.]